jgi:hypothetical protein
VARPNEAKFDTRAKAHDLELTSLMRAMLAEGTLKEQRLSGDGLELHFVIPKDRLDAASMREALALAMSDAL